MTDAHDITLVCDNDTPGKSAATPIARRLKGQRLNVVMFDDTFPPGFDLGKPWPQEERFKKITLRDCTRSGTWATEIVPPPKGTKGRPSHRLTKAFVEEWAWSDQPEVFVNKRNRRMLTESEFNASVTPFSDAKNTAALLKKHSECQAKTVTYRPGVGAFLFIEDGEMRINLWTPTTIKIVKPRWKEIKPWLKFMWHLIPNRTDRNDTLKWIATLIARPDIRILFGLLLIQEKQGVGKTTLLMILRRLVGWHNCSVPNENEVVKADYNYWQVQTRLATVNEIYAGASRKAYNILKSAATDDIITA